MLLDASVDGGSSSVAERRQLVEKARTLRRKARRELGTIVTPDIASLASTAGGTEVGDTVLN